MADLDANQCSYNCSTIQDPPRANPDIAGIGVLIGFVGTAYLVVFLLGAYYLIVFDPKLDPFRKEDDRYAKTSSPNAVDEFFLDSIKTRFRKRTRGWIKSQDPVRLEMFFNKAVRSMSDLQIITGVAILSAGYASLKCGISTYHWEILIYTAWFSSVTHLTAMSFLRNYLYNHQNERLWRICVITGFLGMLLFAIGLSGRFQLDSPGSGPRVADVKFAICYFSNIEKWNEEKFTTMFISMLLLVLSFITRIVKLHKKLANLISGKLRGGASRKFQGMLHYWVKWAEVDGINGNLRYSLIVRPMIALHLTIRGMMDFYSSMFFEVFWLFVSGFWGSIKLYDKRVKHTALDIGEDHWSFGQIVPVMLLLAPFVSIIEFWHPGVHYTLPPLLLPVEPQATKKHLRSSFAHLNSL